MRQGVLSQIDADHFAWRHGSGEVDSDRAGTAPTVKESHPGSQMRRKECGHLSGALGKDGAAPFSVYPVWPLGTGARSGMRLLSLCVAQR
jgi:hypothetical protein